MSTYQTPEVFKTLKSVKVTESKSSWLETIFLGHIECFGYRNKLNAKRRICAAVYQTALASIAIWAFIYAASLILRVLGYPVNVKPAGSDSNLIDEQSLMSLVILIVSVFGATFWREQTDMHSKWRYLADLFNSTTQIDPPINTSAYNKREHLRACLAHDILIMEMWAHRSFRSTFREILECAIIHSANYNSDVACKHLKDIVYGGISYKEAKDFLEGYISYLAPRESKTSYIFERSLARGRFIRKPHSLLRTQAGSET